MKVWNIVKRVIIAELGKKEGNNYYFSNIAKVRELSKSAVKPVMVKMVDRSGNTSIVEACNEYLVEFELFNKKYSYLVDTLFNKTTKLDLEIVEELAIQNSILNS